MTSPKSKIFVSLRLFAASCLVVALAACDADSAPRDHIHRAVELPNGIASANSEAMGAPQGAIPLVTVDLPNRRDEQPVVHTIGESLASLAPSPASRPTTKPAGKPDAPAPFRVVQQKNVNDQFVPIADGDKLGLLITSESGIGSATLERAGDEWPTALVLHFTYPTRVFPRLEGFDANELTAAGARVALKSDINRDAATATIHIPQFVRSSRISIEWVDVYR